MIFVLKVSITVTCIGIKDMKMPWNTPFNSPDYQTNLTYSQTYTKSSRKVSSSGPGVTSKVTNITIWYYWIGGPHLMRSETMNPNSGDKMTKRQEKPLNNIISCKDKCEK